MWIVVIHFQRQWHGRYFAYFNLKWGEKRGWFHVHCMKQYAAQRHDGTRHAPFDCSEMARSSWKWSLSNRLIRFSIGKIRCSMERRFILFCFAATFQSLWLTTQYQSILVLGYSNIFFEFSIFYFFLVLFVVNIKIHISIYIYEAFVIKQIAPD